MLARPEKMAIPREAIIACRTAASASIRGRHQGEAVAVHRASALQRFWDRTGDDAVRPI